MLPEEEVEGLAARLTKKANKGFDRLANSAMGNKAFGRVRLDAMDVEHSSRLVNGRCVVDLPFDKIQGAIASAGRMSSRNRKIATGAGIGVGALLAADVVRHRKMRPSSAQQQYYGY